MKRVGRMLELNRSRIELSVLVPVVLMGLLAGCTPPPDQEALANPAPAPSGDAPATSTDFSPDVDAGVPIDAAPMDPGKLSRLIASRGFSARTDPFALFPTENQFESLQRAERLLQETGGWALEVSPPAETFEEETYEAQPYRRLAGVMVGDTVQAIIVMETGRFYTVRPGMQIPNSEWTVVSIDHEKAILRRSGNRKPNQIVVRLESPPAGMATGRQPGQGGGVAAPGTEGPGSIGAPNAPGGSGGASGAIG